MASTEKSVKLTKADFDPADFYVAPSKLAAAVELPLWPQERWQSAVLNAYATTKFAGRLALAQSEGE